MCLETRDARKLFRPNIFSWFDFFKQSYFLPSLSQPFFCVQNVFCLRLSYCTLRFWEGELCQKYICTPWELFISPFKVPYPNLGPKWSQSEAFLSPSIMLLFYRLHNLQKILLYSPAWNILFQSAAAAFICPVGKQSPFRLSNMDKTLQRLREVLVPLYSALVRSLLESCIQAWGTQHKKNVGPEKGHKDYQRLKHLYSDDRLRELVFSLQKRSLRGHLIVAF